MGNIYIIKRNGERQLFDPIKINNAVFAAAKACNEIINQNPSQYINVFDNMSVEQIQDCVED